MPTMTWWSWLLAGALGGSGTVGLVWKFWPRAKPEVIIVKEEVAKEQLEIEKKLLSNQDLLPVPCSETYLAAHGEQLCREMFCHLMARGVVGNKAEASSCEAISNTINKAYIIKTCAAFDDEAKAKQCVELFDRRI